MKSACSVDCFAFWKQPFNWHNYSYIWITAKKLNIYDDKLIELDKHIYTVFTSIKVELSKLYYIIGEKFHYDGMYVL